MAVTLYTSFDASAPQITASAGSLLAVIEACLVNGYGSKAPLGWTKEFAGTNKGVFRAPLGTRKYVRVDDQLATTYIAGYNTMSSVDAGTNQFPPSVFSTGAGYVALNTRSANQAWELIGDGKRFYLWVWNAANAFTTTAKGSSSCGNVSFFGDFVSHIADDTTDSCAISGLRVTNTYSAYSFNNSAPVLSSGVTSFVCSAKNYWLNTMGYMNPVVNNALMNNSLPMGGSLGLAFPNGPDGGIYFGQILLTEQQTAATQYIRGHLPGIWCPYHSYNSYNHGDTFSGTGAYSGRTFRIWQLYASSMFVETSDTWS